MRCHAPRRHRATAPTHSHDAPEILWRSGGARRRRCIWNLWGAPQKRRNVSSARHPLARSRARRHRWPRALRADRGRLPYPPRTGMAWRISVPVVRDRPMRCVHHLPGLARRPAGVWPTRPSSPDRVQALVPRFSPDSLGTGVHAIAAPPSIWPDHNLWSGQHGRAASARSPKQRRLPGFWDSRSRPRVRGGAGLPVNTGTPSRRRKEGAGLSATCSGCHVYPGPAGRPTSVPTMLWGRRSRNLQAGSASGSKLRLLRWRAPRLRTLSAPQTPGYSDLCCYNHRQPQIDNRATY